MTIQFSLSDSILAGAPGVLSGPFMHSLASPLANPYGAGGVAGGIPGLGGFAAALGQTAPGLRGLATTPGLALATVLLVSNLNEEVSILSEICSLCRFTKLDFYFEKIGSCFSKKKLGAKFLPSLYHRLLKGFILLSIVELECSRLVQNTIEKITSNFCL